MSKNKLRFKEARQHMLDKIQGTASTVGVFVESEAKIRTPVDTGHLRRSISHDTNVTADKSSVFIGTNVEYAEVVELGLGNQEAQPYLIPAIDENVSTIKDLIHKGLKI